jgi:predicted HTH transcriptional regulator
LSRAFYPFVEEDAEELSAQYAARIAVYDDAAAAPRVVVIDPTDVRSYLEEITSEVSRLSREQGGRIPFMVIREVVENLIHAYFIEPAISILNNGDTIRFADQGPGIKEKERALEYGTTSATDAMKRYIRGVGSGLPYAQQYLKDHGGTLEIEDNISGGTIVTISMSPQSVPGPRQPAVQQPRQEQPNVQLSARGEKVIAYLRDHESVGPKDLVDAFGSSQSTWTRELQSLEKAGIVAKRGGQKRYLTTMGETLL